MTPVARWRGATAGRVGPWSSTSPVTVDLAWYGLLVLAGSATLLAGGPITRADPILDVVLLVVGPTPVLLRRRRPRVALVATVLLLVTVALLGRDSSVEVTTLAVVVVTAVAADRRLRPVPVFLLAAGAINAATVLDVRRLAQPVVPSAFVFGTFGTALAVGLGLLLRRHRAALVELAQRNAELDLRNAELDRLRVAEARRAVIDERGRIARELHDVAAHHVAGIAVRAAAAVHVHDRRPDQAAAALTYIAGAAGETLTALRAMVGALRDDPLDPGRSASLPVDLTPQPTLEQVPQLLEHHRENGQRVDLEHIGTPMPVPADVHLAGYRIVQEALTNTLRHAPGAPVRVTLRWRSAALELDIANDAAPDQSGLTPTALTPTPSGHGVLGMTERAALLGGRLRAGPARDGWVVHAVLPLAGPLPAPSRTGCPDDDVTGTGTGRVLLPEPVR